MLVAKLLPIDGLTEPLQCQYNSTHKANWVWVDRFL